jgi:hypothetical protein
MRAKVTKFKRPLWAELNRFANLDAWEDVRRTLGEIANNTGYALATVLTALMETYGERAEHELYRQSERAKLREALNTLGG